MTEVLTESFCERCGTKYTFEGGADAPSPVRRARTLVRGLRYYLLSDDPLDEALAEARRDDERDSAGRQLDAFHKTFNFCIECRQYVCGECWNEAASRCLTCAPMPGRVDVFDLEVDLSGRLGRAIAPSEPAPAGSLGAAADGAGWPAADLVAAPSGRRGDTQPPRPAPEIVRAGAEAILAPPEAAVAPPEPIAEALPEPGPIAGVSPAAEAAPEGIAATAEPAVSEVLAPAPEPSAAAAASPAEAAPAGMPEPAAPAPELALMGTEATAPPAAAAPPPAAAAPPPAAAPPAAPAAPPAPVWQIVAPDEAAPADRGAATGWPARAPAHQPRPPRGGGGIFRRPAQPAPPASPVSSGHAATGTPAAQRSEAEVPPAWMRRAAPSDLPQPPAAGSAVWDDSARGLLERPGSGVQACVSCGLPLSATARFCRRCGTRQG